MLACFSTRDENPVIKFSLITTFPRTSDTIKTGPSPFHSHPEPLPFQNKRITKLSPWSVHTRTTKEQTATSQTKGDCKRMFQA